MKNEIINKLTENGINPQGSNASLVDLIADAVDTVRTFGMDFWLKETTAGSAVKKIVTELV